MDAKDVRIFCEMGYKYLDYNAFTRRRISPSEIGRKLGLTERTVRSRVKKLEEGFIKYYQAIPNLSLLGINIVSTYALQAADIPSKREALVYFRKAPRVIELNDSLGHIFRAAIGGSSPEEVHALVNEIARKLKLGVPLKVFERGVVEPSLTPAVLDWRILQRLRYDALCSSNDIARTLSITYRMVDYRITKLLESRALFIRAIINPQRQEGLIFYALGLFHDESSKSPILDDLKRTHGEKIWMVKTPKEGIMLVYFFTFTPAEPEETLVSTLRVKGVKQANLVILGEEIEPERPNWIDTYIERRIVDGAVPPSS